MNMDKNIYSVDCMDKNIYYFLTGGHRMKRKDLLRKLKAAGLLFKEGGEHTRVYKGDIMMCLGTTKSMKSPRRKSSRTRA